LCNSVLYIVFEFDACICEYVVLRGQVNSQSEKTTIGEIAKAHVLSTAHVDNKLQIKNDK